MHRIHRIRGRALGNPKEMKPTHTKSADQCFCPRKNIAFALFRLMGKKAAIKCLLLPRVRCLLIVSCLLVLLGSSPLSFSSAYAAGIQPTDVLQNGYALFSCFAGGSDQPALAIINLRPAGGLYDDPSNRATTIDVSSSFEKTEMWNLSDFDGGQIMGTSFNRRDGTIYVSTSRMYHGSDKNTPDAPEIWRIAPSGGTPVLFATLPGNQGVGWLDLDEEHDQIYVSNMDDGLIYVIDTTLGPGQTMANTGGYATFAPHAADDLDEDTNGNGILDGMPPLGKRIWGVGYNRVENRLYYFIWTRDDIGSGNNTVRSVAINSDGTIASATDQLEATMTDLTLTWTDGNPKTVQMPASDIDFSQDGQIMLLSEQGFDSTQSSGSPKAKAHLSRLMELQGGSGNWVAEPNSKHRIGDIPGLTEYNSRGGTSFIYHNIDNMGLLEGADEYVITTGDALAVDAGIFIYGLQYHPITGGSTADSLKIDLNGNVNEFGSKFLYGDIDVRMERKDYGDLPDSYDTLDNSNGAAHVIDAITYLGAGVDAESNGQPSLNADGDDDNQDGTHDSDLPDDEDGITFLDPLMPGQTARIQVVAGGDGYLNAFIDFDNNGTLDSVSINPASATGSAGTLSDLMLTAGTHVITIDVPGTTVGDVGDVIYSRFRFTADSGEATTPTGTAATGEVEDYVLMSLGNRVWLDNGAGAGTGDDGAMNGSEVGISGVAVQLYDAAGTTLIAETTTSADGTYLFTGLVPDTYVVHIPASNFGTGQPLKDMSSSTDSATTGNVDPDSDTHDENSDENGIDNADPSATGISSQPITLAYGGEPTSDGNSNNSNLTVDFGFVAYDWGDLPDGNASGSPTYNTLDGSSGPSHIIQSGLFMGTLVDSEKEGQPSATALGDDEMGTPDDEDGVTFPPFYPNESADVDVIVTNAGTTAATLYGFIDFNGDGDFGDAGESINATVPAGSSGTATTLTFNVPATADTTQLLGARFRLSTDSAAASPNGVAEGGEVEDYLISISRLEYGDLPDIYGTVKNGAVITPAVHVISDTVKLGAVIDYEVDGLASDDASGDDIDGSPDDEDGITFLDPLMPGEAARIQVVAGSDGYLNAFIDFDNDGTLDSVTINAASATGSAGPLSDLQLTAGTHIITIDTPGTTTGDVGDVIYSRFRFTANPDEATTPTGFAPTGEVEDYVLMSLGNRVWLDNGAGTGTGDDGAMNGSEIGIGGVTVQLYDATGTTLIAETTTNADGTYLFTGLVPDTYVVHIPASNFGAGQLLEDMSSSTDSATTGNVDPDNDIHDESSDENGIDDGDPAANGISSQPITLVYGGEPTSDGNSSHSNLTVDFSFVAYDWGDLPDGNASGSPSYNTLDSSGGPRHIIQPGLFMGALVDSETEGQPSATAVGDDEMGTPDDEDGVTFPSFYPGESAAIDVTVTNTGTTAATVYGFIDFNGDGDFGDAGESVNVTVPAGSDGTVTTLTFNVPTTADTTQQLGARFRLSTDSAAASADGVAEGGEVEDYLISVSPLEYGDLPDIYGTVRNGAVITPAVHMISDTVKLGTVIDGEADGLANSDADGDDIDGNPDDEDGITFLDPLMPGETARIQVVAGSDGYLNAFIDFDNDGTLDSVTINPASATGSAGTLSDLQLTAGTHLITIDVPGTTVGDVGEVIYSRFRFTANPGEATTPTGFASTGEVEDYALMSLGNRVWLDEGVGNEDNGLFDGNELPAANVLLELYGLNNTLIVTTTTDADGYYLFSGLNEGIYTVTVAAVNFQSGGPLEGYLSTTGADGSDTVDSTSANSDNGIDDLNPDFNGISSNAITLTLGDEPSGEEHLGGTDSSNNSNLTVDFGFYEFIIVFELSKVLNTPSPARIGETISFTIRITNTGETVISELPLIDRYNNAYLDYVSASPLPDNPTSGELVWHDLTAVGSNGFGADLNPSENFEIVVEFISQLDTTALPNESTTNVAQVLEMSDSADVQILAPTSVQLAAREVFYEGQSVALRWETADETEIVGFYLYRRQGEDGTLVQLNQSLMVAENSGRSLGTAYRYTDRTMEPNMDYAYLLGIVNTKGIEAQAMLGEVITWRTLNDWSIYLPIMTK